MGNGHTLGERGGEQSHTLSISETPTHVHTMQGTSDQNTPAVAAPAGNLLGPVSGAYGPAQDLTSLAPSALANVGGSQPHLNMQPFLTLSFCIALQGIFPSQT
jgi:microcystin-dependent protein